jgi:hypothetical protein
LAECLIIDLPITSYDINCLASLTQGNPGILAAGNIQAIGAAILGRVESRDLILQFYNAVQGARIGQDNRFPPPGTVLQGPTTTYLVTNLPVGAFSVQGGSDLFSTVNKCAGGVLVFAHKSDGDCWFSVLTERGAKQAADFPRLTDPEKYDQVVKAAIGQLESGELEFDVKRSSVVGDMPYHMNPENIQAMKEYFQAMMA